MRSCAHRYNCAALSGVPFGFPLRCLLRDRGKGDWDDKRLPPPEHTHSHHASQENSAPSRRIRQRMDLPFMRMLTRIVIEGSMY